MIKNRLRYNGDILRRIFQLYRQRVVAYLVFGLTGITKHRGNRDFKIRPDQLENIQCRSSGRDRQELGAVSIGSVQLIFFIHKHRCRHQCFQDRGIQVIGFILNLGIVLHLLDLNRLQGTLHILH